jgi:hypothetical protein
VLGRPVPKLNTRRASLDRASRPLDTIPRVSNSAGSYRAAEAALLLVWIGVSILILVKVHDPAMALAFCCGAMFLLRGVIRQIRQVRDITEKYRH